MNSGNGNGNESGNSGGEPNHTRTELIVGVMAIAACLLLFFVWIPLDVDSGYFEKVRRWVEIGDAFAPGLAAGLLGLGGLLLIIERLRQPNNTRFSAQNAAFSAGVLVCALIFTQLLMLDRPGGGGASRAGRG